MKTLQEQKSLISGKIDKASKEITKLEIIRNVLYQELETIKSDIKSKENEKFELSIKGWDK